MPKLPLTGGCQCGALRYEINAAPLMVYNCHCTNCQRISASAFNMSMAVLRETLTFTNGEPVRHEWDSGVGTRRYGLLCRTCGTRIAHGMVPEGPVNSLRAGTLDDPSWISPVADIWTRSAHPWALDPENRLQYEKQPEDYGPIMQAFAAQANF
ncbi:MAG: GFA family protein [Henriciella sp.]